MPIVGPQYGGIGRKPSKRPDLEAILHEVKAPVIGNKTLIHRTFAQFNANKLNDRNHIISVNFQDFSI